MRYFDTSILAPLIRKERSSSQVARFMAGVPAGEPTISRWTSVEIASLLARDVRMRLIATDEAREADALFEAIVRRSFVVVSTDSDDFDLARRYLHNYATGLRAGDALHLAIARNRRVDVLYTLDKGMLRAGKMLGLPTSAGIKAD